MISFNRIKGPICLQTIRRDYLAKVLNSWGSGCGSIGRAVASNTRGPRFESRHRQIFVEHLFTVNCIVLKNKNKRKRGREWSV